MATLTLRPPAKINLALRVGGIRPDGYHDVQTVLQSIGLADRLMAVSRRGPFGLVVRGAGVPADRENLVWKAAAALWRAMGRAGDPRDVHLTLEKHVPVGAGLGGGSSNAAAALVLLNTLWQARFPVVDLARLAAELGADVPFFLIGGTALGLGRGDDLYPVDDIRRLGVVVLKPSFGVSTPDAYSWLDEDRRRGSADGGPDEPPRELDVGWPGRGLAIVNELEPPVARRHPELAEMLSACRRAGALATAMTGSGSAVFGLFAEAVSVRAARQLRRPDWLVLPTRTLTRREAGRRIGV
jgi:4-diphosphocytidyl-2-C-methyl-D-erythritol kinase